jgi:putative SOS response-associated peptidase YedK
MTVIGFRRIFDCDQPAVPGIRCRSGPRAFSPRFNVAPAQSAPIIRQIDGREVIGCIWGLVPHWAKDPAIGNKMINARSETSAEKPSFKNALAGGAV